MHNLTTTQQQTHPENSIIKRTNKEKTCAHTAKERRNLIREQEQEGEKAEQQKKTTPITQNARKKKNETPTQH